MADSSLQQRRQLGIQVDADEGLILQRLVSWGPASRTELAHDVRFSPGKVSDLAAGLLSRQVLIEIEGGHGKWKNLSVNPGRGFLIGIDIGTTSVDVALADCACQLIRHKSTVSDVNQGPEHVLGQALSMLTGILEEEGVGQERLLGIGVGIPGPVKYPSGEVIGGQFTPGWEGMKIQEILSEHFPQAVIKVDNDANLMAIGSHQAGLAKRINDFIFVKIGTGIGAGIYCQGHLHRGATSCAGHIGHNCVTSNGPVCRCGNRGCLEAMAGGEGMAAAAHQAADAGESQILVRLRTENNGRLTARQIGEAAGLQDQAAQGIIVRSARLIGSVLAGVTNLYNPKLIVLGGGISKLGDLFLAEIRREVLKRAYTYATLGLQITLSPMIDDLGVTGAIHLARDWVYAVEGRPLSALD